MYTMRALPAVVAEARAAVATKTWPLRDPEKVTIMGSGAFGVVGNDVDLITPWSNLADTTSGLIEIKPGRTWARVNPNVGRVSLSALPDETFAQVTRTYDNAVRNHAEQFLRQRAEGVLSKEDIYRAAGILLTRDYRATL